MDEEKAVLLKGGVREDDIHRQILCWHVPVKWVEIMRTTIVLLASMAVALQCGTTNAFNTISGYIAKDQDISDSLMTLLASAGIIGMFFTIPAGIANDRFGAFKTAVVGAVMAVSGYLVMSFTNKGTYAVMLISFLAYAYTRTCTCTRHYLIMVSVVGFGCGTSFLCALATGIKALANRPGLGVALVGACMSLSLALTNQFVAFDRNVVGCDEDKCWPEYLRTLCVTSAIFMFFPCFFLLLVRSDPPVDRPESIEGDDLMLNTGVNSDHQDYDQLHKGLRRSEIIDNELKQAQSTTPVSLLYSVRIMKNIFFWFLIYGYFAGIGSGLLIITGTENIWKSFTKGDHDNWSVNITTAFSVANMVGNVLSGWLSDFCWDKFKVSRHLVLSFFLGTNCIIFCGMAGLSYYGDRDSTGWEVLFFVLMVSVGFHFGTYLSFFPIIVGDYYGHVNFGMYFGYIQFGSCAATFAIPNAATAIFQSLDEYNIAFIILACLLGSSAILIFLKRPTPVGKF